MFHCSNELLQDDRIRLSLISPKRGFVLTACALLAVLLDHLQRQRCHPQLSFLDDPPGWSHGAYIPACKLALLPQPFPRWGAILIPFPNRLQSTTIPSFQVRWGRGGWLRYKMKTCLSCTLGKAGWMNHLQISLEVIERIRCFIRIRTQPAHCAKRTPQPRPHLSPQSTPSAQPTARRKLSPGHRRDRTQASSTHRLIAPPQRHSTKRPSGALHKNHTQGVRSGAATGAIVCVW
jgi:hypothetical protein